MVSFLALRVRAGDVCACYDIFRFDLLTSGNLWCVLLARCYTATNKVYRLQTAVSRAEGVCVVLFIYFELRHCKVYVRPVLPESLGCA